MACYPYSLTMAGHFPHVRALFNKYTSLDSLQGGSDVAVLSLLIGITLPADDVTEVSLKELGALYFSEDDPAERDEEIERKMDVLESWYEAKQATITPAMIRSGVRKATESNTAYFWTVTARYTVEELRQFMLFLFSGNADDTVWGDLTRERINKQAEVIATNLEIWITRKIGSMYIMADPIGAMPPGQAEFDIAAVLVPYVTRIHDIATLSKPENIVALMLIALTLPAGSDTKTEFQKKVSAFVGREDQPARIAEVDRITTTIRRWQMAKVAVITDAASRLGKTSKNYLTNKRYTPAELNLFLAAIGLGQRDEATLNADIGSTVSAAPFFTQAFQTRFNRDRDRLPAPPAAVADNVDIPRQPAIQGMAPPSLAFRALDTTFLTVGWLLRTGASRAVDVVRRNTPLVAASVIDNAQRLAKAVADGAQDIKASMAEAAAEKKQQQQDATENMFVLLFLVGISEL